MKRFYKWALFTVGGLLCFVGMSVLVLFPYTNPFVIRLKTHVIGSGLTYAPLAADDDKWEYVLKGAQSGDDTWLKVASDLRSALDTHPGEEMLGAVSTAFDKNPNGAVRILLPSYGAQIVCGDDEKGSIINHQQAQRRANLLEGLPASPEREACIGVIRKILNESAK